MKGRMPENPQNQGRFWDKFYSTVSSPKYYYPYDIECI